MRIFTPVKFLSEDRPPSEKALEALSDGTERAGAQPAAGDVDGPPGAVRQLSPLETRISGKLLRGFGESFFEAGTVKIARFLMARYVRKLWEGDGKSVVSGILALWLPQLGRIEHTYGREGKSVFLLASCG